MSETDMPIMPTPHVLYAKSNTFTRYRPSFTSFQVFEIADNGRRVEISDDGRLIVFDFTQDQSRQIALMLSSRDEV